MRSLTVAVFVLVMQVLAGVSVEPQCSSFHYQEQMLEKMIRLEILVKTMKDDMDLIQDRVTKTLESLEAKWITMTTDFDDMRKKIDESMTTYRKEIDFNTALLRTPLVVFFAKDLASTKPNNEEILIFKTTLQNEGGGYDNTTGLFTAPFRGTYLFTAQLCTGDASKTHVLYDIATDDRVIQKGLLQNRDIYNCYNTNVVTTLEALARVWIIFRTGTTTFRQTNEYWISFNGVLLQTS